MVEMDVGIITLAEGPHMRICLACPYPFPPRPDGHSPLARRSALAYSRSFYLSSSSFSTSTSSSPPPYPFPVL
eukprot:5844367-Pyramimonas_sp.AAC.1